MSDTPELSVVVPIYKVRHFLSQCLCSLSAQTLKNVEFILVNDGSPDDSGQIAAAFAQENSAFRYFEKQNGGLSDARNFGIDRARGAYIGFVDSDDWVEPRMFELMLAEAKRCGAEIVIANFYMHESGEAKEGVPWSKFADPTMFNKSVREDPRLLRQGGCYAWNKIYSRRLFEERGYRFPKEKSFEDSHIVYNMMLDANRIGAVTEPLYHYRVQRPGSITAEVTPHVFDVFDSVNSIQHHFAAAAEADKAMRRAVTQRIATHIFGRFSNVMMSSSRILALRYIMRAFRVMDSIEPKWRRTVRLNPSNIPIYVRAALEDRRFAWYFICLPRWAKMKAIVRLEEKARAQPVAAQSEQPKKS